MATGLTDRVALPRRRAAAGPRCRGLGGRGGRAVALALGLAVCCAAALAQARGGAAPTPVEDTMAQRMQACVVCHGKEGRATNAGYFPRIAGKPAGYLFNQLQNFRDGRRRNPAMTHLVRHMTDDYLREIAAYFSGLDLPYPPARPHGLSAAQQQVAEQLVLHGLPQRQVPACVSCHGADMTGRLPAMPGLLALPADYLIAQFGAWRTDARRAAAPDCMSVIARRLEPEEIVAVSRWLAAQAPPAGAAVRAPAQPQPQPPLPMPCGSSG